MIGALPHHCTSCLSLRGLEQPARFVVRGATGLEWYECDAHGALDNPLDDHRTDKTPIDEWFRIHGLAVTIRPRPASPVETERNTERDLTRLR